MKNSALRGEMGRECDFLSDQKVTKESPGPPSMSAFAERALIGGLPRTPLRGGRPPEDLALASGGSEHKTLHPPCPGDTGPCRVRNQEVSALYGHRLLWQNRGSWSGIGCAVRRPTTAAPNR